VTTTEGLIKFYVSDAKLLVEQFGHADLLKSWRITASRGAADGYARSDASDFLDDMGARLQNDLRVATQKGDHEAMVKAEGSYLAFCNVSDLLRKQAGLNARDDRTLDEIRGSTMDGRRSRTNGSVSRMNGKKRGEKPRTLRTLS